MANTILLPSSQHYKICSPTLRTFFSKDTPICLNSYANFTKIEIRSSLSWFEHCSESLIWPIGSHIWSLFGPIHMKTRAKVNLGQIQVCSNIAQNHSSGPLGSPIWSLFALVHLKSRPKVKLGQVQVGSNIAQNHSSSP